jgi:hypothetical protein
VVLNPSSQPGNVLDDRGVALAAPLLEALLARLIGAPIKDEDHLGHRVSTLRFASVGMLQSYGAGAARASGRCPIEGLKFALAAGGKLRSASPASSARYCNTRSAHETFATQHTPCMARSARSSPIPAPLQSVLSAERAGICCAGAHPSPSTTAAPSSRACRLAQPSRYVRVDDPLCGAQRGRVRTQPVACAPARHRCRRLRPASGSGSLLTRRLGTSVPAFGRSGLQSTRASAQPSTRRLPDAARRSCGREPASQTSRSNRDQPPSRRCPR